MFMKFEASSTVARKGFRAFIHRIGKLISLKISEKIAKGENPNYFYLLLQMIIVSIGRTYRT